MRASACASGTPAWVRRLINVWVSSMFALIDVPLAYSITSVRAEGIRVRALIMLSRHVMDA